MQQRGPLPVAEVLEISNAVIVVLAYMDTWRYPQK